MKLTVHVKETMFLLFFGILLWFSSWKMLVDYLNPLHWEESPEAFGVTFDSFLDVFGIVVGIYVVFKIKTIIGKMFWGIFVMSSLANIILRINLRDASLLVLVEMADKIVGASLFTVFGLIILFTKKPMHVFEEKPRSVA